MSKRTPAVLKVLCEVQEDRKIVTFPEAFLKSCTPYDFDGFEVSVKNACYNESFVSTTDLKISKVIVVGDVAVGKTCIVNRYRKILHL